MRDVAQRLLIRIHGHLAQPPFPVGQRLAQDRRHVLLPQGFKGKHPAPADDGGGHGGHGVFRGGTDKADEPLLHSRQNGIALRLGPAVAFIQQQVRCLSVQLPPLRGSLQLLPHVGHAAGDRVHFHKSGLRHVGDHAGQRRFAAPRRAVKNAAGQAIRLDRPPQKTSRPHNVRLPEKFVQTAGAHPIRQRGEFAILRPFRKVK